MISYVAVILAAPFHHDFTHRKCYAARAPGWSIIIKVIHQEIKD